jgi:hypothetical protein
LFLDECQTNTKSTSKYVFPNNDEQLNVAPNMKLATERTESIITIGDKCQGKLSRKKTSNFDNIFSEGMIHESF